MFVIINVEVVINNTRGWISSFALKSVKIPSQDSKALQAFGRVAEPPVSVSSAGYNSYLIVNIASNSGSNR